MASDRGGASLLRLDYGRDPAVQVTSVDSAGLPTEDATYAAASEHVPVGLHPLAATDSGADPYP